MNELDILTAILATTPIVLCGIATVASMIKCIRIDLRNRAERKKVNFK